MPLLLCVIFQLFMQKISPRYMAQATLAQWQENLPIAVAQKPLYR